MEQYNLRRARVTVSGRREPTYLADEIGFISSIRKGTRCRQRRTAKITAKNITKKRYGAMNI
jgi:hypothetical protein